MKNASSCAHVRTMLFFAKLEWDNNQEKKWPWKKRGSCTVRKQKWKREKWRNGSFSSHEACMKQYIRSRPPSEALLPSSKGVALQCGSVRVLSAHVCYCFVLFSFLFLYVCLGFIGCPWSRRKRKRKRSVPCATKSSCTCAFRSWWIWYSVVWPYLSRVTANGTRQTLCCSFVYLLFFFFWLSSSVLLSLFVFPLRLFVFMCICIYLYVHLCAQTLTHFHTCTHANIWRLNPQKKKKTYHYDYVVYFQSKNWGKRA